MLSCATCGAKLRRGAPFCAQCGQSAPEPGTAGAEAVTSEPADPLLGEILARKFRIQSVLGQGGMGKVYRAEQLPLNVDVVIKTLHAPLAADPVIVKRFFREAQAASRLRHPNCVSVLDFGDADGTLYIAMEFLRGRSLARVLEEDGRFEPRRAVRVLGQVLDVLAAAHQMNIVHRDLKPDNIMVEDLATQRDFVKVLDFGIAKILDPMGREGAKLTQTGTIFGTPSYMAPEQAMGGEIDGRTDLYSVGVVLFELLTKRLPFYAESLPVLLVEQATKPAPPILTIRPDLPPALAAIVDTCLAKDPDERHQTALDLKTALEAADVAVRAAVAIGATQAIPVPERLAEAVRGFEAVHPPCPRCGQPLPVTAKFCGECGASTGRSGPTDLKDKFAELRRYLPSGVVDELSQMRVRGAGEKREIVVLVVDLTAAPLPGAAAEADGEGAERVLAELLAQLSEIALRHTGTLERGPASGAIVVFGLTMIHADEAERAVTTALEMRELMKGFGERHRWTVEATYAIHGGAAIVEPSERGHAYSPIGDSVELPTRLAAAGATGKILVSEQVQKQIRSQVQLRQLPPVALKGRAAAVPAFEVISTRIVVESPHAALARPALAGREEALEAILGLIAQTQTGRAVHIVGEPGIGKSRLLEELAGRLSARRHIAIAAPARPGLDRISPTISRLVAALGGSPDALRSLGVEPQDTRLLFRYLEHGEQALDDHAMQSSIAGILRTAFERAAARTPIAILVDDLHLADAMTTAVVTRWMGDPVPRCVLVATSRLGYPTPWASASATHVRTATLGGLSDDAIAELVSGAIAPTPAPRDLRTAVVGRAGGSPAMALGVLRAMIDGGVLTSIGGRWTITGDLASVARPAGLRALYAARIDALSAYTRDVLACAAVIGDELSIETVDHIIGRAHGIPIEPELRLLVTRGLLAETAEPGKIRFAETSAREAVYERMGRETRRRLHHAVAVLLAGGSPITVPEEAIGEHYELGGDPSQALAWFARAVATATRGRDHRRAVAILRRAREVARAGDPIANNRRLAEDSLALGDLLLELGELAAAREVIAEGLACAHKDDDPMLIARLRRSRGRVHLATSDLEAAMVDLDAALTAAIGIRNRLLIAVLHGDLGEVHEKRGDGAKSIDYMMRALELIQGGESGDVQRVVLRLLTGLGRVCLRGRDYDRAERFLQQALDLAESTDDKLGAAKVLGNLAGVWHARSDFATAIKFSEGALELSREIGDLVGTARQLNNLGTLCSLRGDLAAAIRHYDSAFALAQRTGWREGMATAAAARDRLNSTGTPAR